MNNNNNLLVIIELIELLHEFLKFVFYSIPAINQFSD